VRMVDHMRDLLEGAFAVFVVASSIAVISMSDVETKQCACLNMADQDRCRQIHPFEHPATAGVKMFPGEWAGTCLRFACGGPIPAECVPASGAQ
jgi:hypothetical protein